MAPCVGMTLRAFRPSDSLSAPSANGFDRPSAIDASSSPAPDPPGTLFLPSPDLVMLSLRSFESPRGDDVAAATAAALGPRSLLELLPLLRLRDLMTSVLSEIGRARPFILKKRAQALHKMCVLSCDRRQRGVVYVHGARSILYPSRESLPLPRRYGGSPESRNWHRSVETVCRKIVRRESRHQRFVLRETSARAWLTLS